MSVDSLSDDAMTILNALKNSGLFSRIVSTLSSRKSLLTSGFISCSNCMQHFALDWPTLLTSRKKLQTDNAFAQTVRFDRRAGKTCHYLQPMSSSEAIPPSTIVKPPTPGRTMFFKISDPSAVTLIRQIRAASSNACPCSPHKLRNEMSILRIAAHLPASQRTYRICRSYFLFFSDSSGDSAGEDIALDSIGSNEIIRKPCKWQQKSLKFFNCNSRNLRLAGDWLLLFLTDTSIRYLRQCCHISGVLNA